MPQPDPDLLLAAVRYASREFELHRLQRRFPVDDQVAWRELVAVTIGSAARYEQAADALDGVIGILPRPWELSALEWGRLRHRLESGRVRLPTRFPIAHSRYLVRTIGAIYVGGEGLLPLLALEPPLARRELVRLAAGVGPKQASLLLMNLGVSDDFASLDRHVLRYMAWLGLTCDDRRPGTLKAYEGLEDRLRTHAQGLGFRLTDLDRAAWVAVRTWGGLSQ